MIPLSRERRGEVEFLHRAAKLSPASALLADHLRSGIANPRDDVSLRRRTDSVIPIA